MTRLKIGLAGLGAMLLIVGLSSVINDRVRETEASAVPEAAATTEPTQPPSSPKGDPLAEGGVVPDLPEPTATPTQPPAILPEQGAQLDDIDAR